MSKAKQASVSLDNATARLMAAAKKRRIAAYRYWKSLPRKSYATVGKEFGVSRQRACVMVKQGAEDALS